MLTDRSAGHVVGALGVTMTLASTHAAPSMPPQEGCAKHDKMHRVTVW